MTYHAKAATVGNSKALRLESALFRAHPEFSSGEFTVSVIAPGRLLVQATSQAAKDETDPVFDAFLGFLEHQMAQRPDLISAVTRSDLNEADAVLKGVDSDRDEDLGDAFVMPGPRPAGRSHSRPSRASRKQDRRH